MDWTTWGTIGDTFGGLIGALVNPLLLGTTLWLAVWRQPRIDRSHAEELEASRVIAWPAETYLPAESEQENDPPRLPDAKPDYHGVVLANTSTSTVREVDIKLIIRHSWVNDGSTSAPKFSIIPGYRELILPPGTWFIPLQCTESAASYEWKLPLPVDTNGKLQVSMDGTQTYDLRMQQLRQDGGKESTDGEAFGIGFLRFTLNTRTWWRDTSGHLRPFVRAKKLNWLDRLTAKLGRSSPPCFPNELDAWENEFNDSGAQKGEIAVESNSAREANKKIANRIYEHYRQRNIGAERNQGTGVLLGSNIGGGAVIRLAGSGTRFPDSLTVVNGNAYDKVLSQRVFNAVLDALPSSEYTTKWDLRKKTADFWQDDANFSILIRGLDAGLAALESEVQALPQR